MTEVLEKHREANSASNWDALWKQEGRDSWRKTVLEDVYSRIAKLLPRRAKVVDIGGGIGILAKILQEDAGATCTVLDISPEAVEQAKLAGVGARIFDIEDPLHRITEDAGVVVSTECLEHLSPTARYALLEHAAKVGKGFFSVPNDRLGPEEEPQHTRTFTALEFKQLLEQFFEHVRVEVLGPLASPRNQPAFLLGICGFKKPTKLSVCFPARNEAADIEKTLASFRGVADEMVIGIDPRTTDNTRELAEKYAEVVFTLEAPKGEGTNEVKATNGVNFAWIRNQCIDRCSNEWFFMTEAHESLMEGQDALLNFALPKGAEAAKVVTVLRVGGPPGWRQQWSFPWMAKKDPRIRYIRATHNSLDFPDGTLVLGLPQVRTLHERDHANDVARNKQRKGQNRISLLDDWLRNQNENSLYYLGSEWRAYDDEKAVKYMKEYLQLNTNNGALRYHTRLVIAKTLAGLNKHSEAKDILHLAARDDWNRTDHWIWLGDLSFNEGRFEEALQYYLYASTRIGKPPITTWWIDLPYYTWIPPQRLAMVYGELGDVSSALLWAKEALVWQNADGVPPEMIEEAESNVQILTEALEQHGHRQPAGDGTG